jgi:hypothetical protein
VKKLKKRKPARPPENGAGNGRLCPGHSVGKTTRFKPGICADPGGRPKLKVVGEAARALLASIRSCCGAPGTRWPNASKHFGSSTTLRFVLLHEQKHHEQIS